jgi:transposase
VTSGSPLIHLLPARRFALSDAQWARIVPLLPPQKPHTGRPNHDHRTFLAGMLWILQTGSSWRDLPAQFGPWHTVYGRYQRWRRAGIWQQVLDILSQGNASACT